MVEYIDREALLDRLEYLIREMDLDLNDDFDDGFRIGLERAMHEIELRPAADVRPVPDGGIGEMSDGYHTFNGLYYQRMILFASLVKQNKGKAWKSWRHEDGELCFGGGWFIVGIDTPEGSYTYHYEDKDWDLFDCTELPVAKHWDGHTEKDVTRLLSLDMPRWIPVTERLPGYGDKCLAVIRRDDGKQRVGISYCFVQREGFWSDKGADWNVTHWMPLPSTEGLNEA